MLLIGVDPGAFWSQMQGGVDVWRDVGNGVVKSFVFGVTVTFIALLQGFEAQPTPEGVSRATTRTVVVASLVGAGAGFRPHGHDVQHLILDKLRTIGNTYGTLQKRCLGGPVRADRRGGPAVPGAAVGQPAEPEFPADLPGGRQVRQHRRPQAPGGGQERRRGGRPGGIDHASTTSPSRPASRWRWRAATCFRRTVR